MKNKKIIKLAILIIIISIFIIVCKKTYAIYILTRHFESNITSAPFYFEVDNLNTDITVQRDMYDELISPPTLNLVIHNNDGTNFDSYNVEYTVSIIDSSKFTFETGDTVTKTISGGKKDENVTLNFVIKNPDDTSKNVKLKVTSTYPYPKSFEFTLPIKNEWLIYKIEDLVLFSRNVNNGKTYSDGSVLLMNNLNFQDEKDYRNAQSIEFGDINGINGTQALKTELTTGSGFYPIGEDANFVGNFEGRKNTISNLYMRKPNSIPMETTFLLGFFANTGDATIKDLTIDGSIEVEDNPIHTNVSMGILGGIVSKVKGNTILDNVHNKVTLKNAFGRNSVGGIVGEVEKEFTLTVTNSDNYGNVSNGNHTAGIVALGYGDVTIINCQNYGIVSNDQGATGMGGIMAVQDSSSPNVVIRNSKNYGKITTGKTIANEQKVGGVIGQVKGKIALLENCDNSGECVSEYNSSNPTFKLNYGGIVGRLAASTLHMINCHNYGKIDGGYRLGGVLGHINTGGTIIMVNSSNEAEIIADSHNAQGFGGIVGYIGKGHAYILNSYNKGGVTANGGTSSGIVGNFDSSTDNSVVILNSYNQGNIVSKLSYASGIVNVDASSSSTASITLNNVYNSGTISGSSTSNSYGVGHVLKASSISIKNTYYKSGITGGNSLITGTTEMTDVNMKLIDQNNVNGLLYKLNNNLSIIGTDINNIKNDLISRNIIDANFDFSLKRWKIDSSAAYPILINN